MTVETTKLAASGLIGDSATGVKVAKLAAYVLMVAGSEEGASPNVNQSYTYAQILDPED